MDERPPQSSATRRYQRRFWPLMAAYVVLILGVALFLKHVAVPQPVKVAAAVLPAIPLVGVIVTVGLYLRDETDEFRRMTMVFALLWGSGGTLAITTVWGFLEFLADAPDLPLAFVFPIFCLAMGIAHRAIGWWYR